MVSNVSFLTWKTIQLGTHSSADVLLEAIEAKGNHIGDVGKDILKRISVSPKRMKIDLVMATPAELGFPKGDEYRRVCVGAKEFGLDRCPAEVGPQLRLQYQSQSVMKRILIAMEPITVSRGYYPDVFCVDRLGDELWLAADYGDIGQFLGPGCRLVFVRSKPA